MSHESGPSRFDQLLRELASAPPVDHATHLQPGDRIGRYEVRELIGQGGFGVVYRAWDPGAERELAVKLAWRASAQAAAEDDLRETRTIAGLDHPNIVSLFDYGQHRGHHYLVFEYLKGQTLQQRLQQGPLDWREALRISLAVASALAYAHERGVVHRDVKPSNVFLRDDAQCSCKLLDFGLAHSLDRARHAPRAGTPGFTAPEGARDTCSDVFSAGMTLYCCLSGGTLPFATRVGVGTREPLQAVPVAPTHALLDELRAPWSVKRLLARATDLDARQRPRDGAAWLRGLRRARRLAVVPSAKRAGYGAAAGLFLCALAALLQLHERREGQRLLALRNALVAQLAQVPLPTAAPAALHAAAERPDPLAAGRHAPERVETVLVREDGSVKYRKPVHVPHFVDYIDGVELVMLQIPAGSFEMGTPKSEPGHRPEEEPLHHVELKGFYIGRYEVTLAQWQKVAQLPRVETDLQPNPVPHGSPDAPVVSISWREAIEFCQRLSRHTGRHYRLPSEAEWEYAARAGSGTAFAFGPNLSVELANYNCELPYDPSVAPGHSVSALPCDRSQRREAARPVGSYGVANAFGLYDVHGNVWEWCQDAYGTYVDAPTDGTARQGGPDDARVIRGGAWTQSAEHVRVGYRMSAKPDQPFDDIGFRIAAAL